MSGLLLHSPAHIVSRIPIAHGLASDAVVSLSNPWPIVVSRILDKPDNLITIRNTTGRDNGFIQYSGELTEMPGLQIRVRGKSEDDTHEKARRLAVLFDEGVNDEVVVLDDSVYVVHSVDRVGGVISLGTEQQATNRNLFTINFICSITLTNIDPDDLMITQDGEYMISQ